MRLRCHGPSPEIAIHTQDSLCREGDDCRRDHVEIEVMGKDGRALAKCEHLEQAIVWGALTPVDPCRVPGGDHHSPAEQFRCPQGCPLELVDGG